VYAGEFFICAGTCCIFLSESEYSDFLISLGEPQAQDLGVISLRIFATPPHRHRKS
jgi:hypothetical protein